MRPNAILPDQCLVQTVSVMAHAYGFAQWQANPRSHICDVEEVVPTGYRSVESNQERKPKCLERVSVCKHPNVSEINESLLRNEAYRGIAKRFAASESAIYRHQQEHLPAALVKANDAAEVVQADSLMGKIIQLEQEARRLGKKAEDAGDIRAAMVAVRELVRIVELLAKIQGELKEPGGTTVNVVYVNARDLGKATGRRYAGPVEPGELVRTNNPAESVTVDVISSR